MKPNIKILVTGANGQLGREMRQVAGEMKQKGGIPADFLFSDVVPAEGLDTVLLDITDIDALRDLVRSEGIDAIVNCAAYTNVDKAETDEAFCTVLNADAPRNLATVMAGTGGLLVHISTDYVFGREPYNTPCTEDRTGTPTGVYGRTKLEGEKNIIASGCSYVIIRTAWLYSEFGRNFCRTMLSLTETKPSLNVVFDQVGTPTYALDLARAIAVVLRDYASFTGRSATPGTTATPGVTATPGIAATPGTTATPGITATPGVPGACSAACDASCSGACDAGLYPKSGIYHYSNEGVCSWYDFTMAIAEFSGHNACRINPCHSDEFPSPVVRPAYSVLDKTKIKTVFGLEIPYWTDSLRICIDKLLGR